MFLSTINIEVTALRKVILLIVTSLFLVASYGQQKNGKVTGTLIDSITNKGVANATIFIVNQQDTQLRASVISSDGGYFEIGNLNYGDYSLAVSYQGSEVIKTSFSISGNKSNYHFEQLKLPQEYKRLKEVVVRGVVPMKVNGDTLTYNADAFKTKPDATVEDLLRKLPGVQVNRNGSVEAQGEQVQKIYVDGKEFFGSDPKIATQNLTADMVQEVMVYNDLSEQAKFSGIDDGSRTKAINLKLKKEKKSGIIGKAYAGYGTDSRYIAGVTSNYFKGATQISIVAGSNNINAGNAIQNMNSLQGGGGFGSGGNGISKASSFGLNYRDTWGKGFDVNGSYFFSNTNTSNLRKSFKQSFFNDSAILTSRQDTYNNIIEDHRANLNIIYTIDSFNSIIYTPNLYVQNLTGSSVDTFTDYVKKKDVQYKAGAGGILSNTRGYSINLTNNLIWRRKFNKPGRTFSVNLSNASNADDRNGYNVNNTRFYNEGGYLYGQRNTNYKINTNSQATNYALSLSFTEPLSANKFLEANYSYGISRSASNRQTYNYDNVTHSYDGLVDSFTNKLENKGNFNRIGANFKTIQKKYNYQLGLAVEKTELEYNDNKKNVNLTQRYINIFPTASFNYQFRKNKTFQVNYRGNNNVPFITQLQDITDITSYPYIRKGNPYLKQEFVNKLMLTYNSFDMSTLQNFFINVYVSSTHNKIVNSIEQKAGEQISMPVNLNGAYTLGSSFNFGFPIQNMEGGNFQSTTHFDYTRNVNLINNLKSFLNYFSAGEELSINYNYQEKLYLTAGAGISYNSARYTIQKEQNSAYLLHNYSLDASWDVLRSLRIYTTADYTMYSGKQASDFGKNYLMWNAGISKYLFKNKRGELKASLIDILNQSVNNSRNVGDNYIIDVQNNTLKRFGLLTFTYKFK